MPEEDSEGIYAVGTYRWSPRDGQVEQYGYRQATATTSDWIKLGLVTLKDALTLRS